jgi:hypothetical protein
MTNRWCGWRRTRSKGDAAAASDEQLLSAWPPAARRGEQQQLPRFERNLNTGGRNYDETQGMVAHTALHHSAEHPSSVTITVVKN